MDVTRLIWFSFSDSQTTWVSSPKECNFPETIPEEASSVEEERVVIFRLPASSFKPSIYTAVSDHICHTIDAPTFTYISVLFSHRPTRAFFNKAKSELPKRWTMNAARRRDSILIKFIGMRIDVAKNRRRKGIRTMRAHNRIKASSTIPPRPHFSTLLCYVACLFCTGKRKVSTGVCITFTIGAYERLLSTVLLRLFTQFFFFLSLYFDDDSVQPSENKRRSIGADAAGETSFEFTANTSNRNFCVSRYEQ